MDDIRLGDSLLILMVDDLKERYEVFWDKRPVGLRNSTLPKNNVSLELLKVISFENVHTSETGICALLSVINLMAEKVILLRIIKVCLRP